MARRTGSLRLVDTPSAPADAGDFPGPVSFDLEHMAPGVSMEDGVLSVDHDDGSVTIDFNPEIHKDDDEEDKDNFYRNLAAEMDESKLNEIASDLIEGINRDEQSRKEWLDTRAKGIQLLGLRIEDPRTDIGASSAAPLEGMSSIRHPLLLEATVRFQATARGELLPAAGPVKIRNDSTTPPRKRQAPQQPPQSQLPALPGAVPPSPAPPMGGLGMAALPQPGGGGPLGTPPSPLAAPPPPTPLGMPPAIGHNGGPPLEEIQPWSDDELADALETDMNHYLTVTATEYVPDTDRMLFYVGFGGDGFKKVYNCPLRRRPVSESVDAEDLVVSNASTDIRNCGRVTHKIKMRKSILKRMQIIKAYLDIDLNTPVVPPQDAVEQEKQAVSGIRETLRRPEDQDYSIYETYCELDLPEFAPKRYKDKGLPLPYRVTIEKDSQKILSIVRNWKEDDEQCIAKQFFVQFPFIRGIGFYGIGLIHILGNTTNALTAMWRESVDAGMFANFPGFIYAAQLGRQLTNQFRVPPGGGIPLQVGAMQSIRDAVMPLPYKELSPSFASMVQHIEERGDRLGQIAEISVGEGKQEAPVGTTLALIEQATKTLDAVHKRMHSAQAEEFALLKERFMEDPAAFWRHNKRPTIPWKKEQFVKALDKNDLVPVADPNNPTSLHRMAKATALEMLASKYPLLIDPKAAIERVFRIANIDSEGLFHDQPQPPPPDPRMEAIKEKAQTGRLQQMVMDADSKRKLQIAILQLQDRAQDRQSREQLEGLRVRIEQLRFLDERNQNQQEVANEWRKVQAELAAEASKNQMELHASQQRNVSELGMDMLSRRHEMAMTQAETHNELSQKAQEHQQELARERERHLEEMNRAREKHAQDMAHQREMHEAKLTNARALAKISKSAQNTGKSTK